MKITTKRVAMMLAGVWISSMLISYIPIFTGWYTTAEHLRDRSAHPDRCEFVVNKPYAVISSSVSFWIPCCIMLFTYWRIYLEATRQEKFIYKSQMGPAAHPVHTHRKKSSNPSGTSGLGPGAGAGGRLSTSVDHSTSNTIAAPGPHPPHRNSHADDPESGSSTPTKRTISKMKREHKAAKTLGIIMGAFILCWLPFFIWYVSIHMCGDTCREYCPEIVVDILFWIGYFNSSLNPIIYAYFNREFREAFKETLQNVFCCCVHLQCLEQQRRHDDITTTYNSNYHRSTQEIGLVENKPRSGGGGGGGGQGLQDSKQLAPKVKDSI